MLQSYQPEQSSLVVSGRAQDGTTAVSGLAADESPDARRQVVGSTQPSLLTAKKSPSDDHGISSTHDHQVRADVERIAQSALHVLAAASIHPAIAEMQAQQFLPDSRIKPARSASGREPTATSCLTAAALPQPSSRLSKSSLIEHQDGVSARRRSSAPPLPDLTRRAHCCPTSAARCPVPARGRTPDPRSGRCHVDRTLFGRTLYSV